MNVYTNFGSVPVINYTFILWKNTEPGAFHPTNNFWFDDKNFKLISSSERKLFSLSTGKGIKYECKVGMPKQVNIVYRGENILWKKYSILLREVWKISAFNQVSERRYIYWVFFCIYHKLFFIYLQNLLFSNTIRVASELLMQRHNERAHCYRDDKGEPRVFFLSLSSPALRIPLLSLPLPRFCCASPPLPFSASRVETIKGKSSRSEKWRSVGPRVTSVGHRWTSVWQNVDIGAAMLDLVARGSEPSLPRALE